MAYQNGQLPAGALTETSGGKVLTDEAAASYERTSRAFEKKFKKPLKFNSGATGYRTLGQQTQLYKQLGYPKAAIPGTSNHGWGLAGDFTLQPYGSDEWKWMNTTGRTYGWEPLNEKNLSFEPWHWVYNEAKDKHIPKPTPEEEVPTIKSAKATKTNQKIGTVIEGSGKSTWTTIKFSDDGKTLTIVADPKHSFLSDIKLSLKGVPVGATVQGRLYWVDTDGDGSNAVRASTYELIERLGTDGNTYVDWNQTGGHRTPKSGKKSSRVRAEIQVIVPKNFKGSVNVVAARAITQVF